MVVQGLTSASGAAAGAAAEREKRRAEWVDIPDLHEPAPAKHAPLPQALLSQPAAAIQPGLQAGAQQPAGGEATARRYRSAEEAAAARAEISAFLRGEFLSRPLPAPPADAALAVFTGDCAPAKWPEGPLPERIGQREEKSKEARLRAAGDTSIFGGKVQPRPGLRARGVGKAASRASRRGLPNLAGAAHDGGGPAREA